MGHALRQIACRAVFSVVPQRPGLGAWFFEDFAARWLRWSAEAVGWWLPTRARSAG